MHIETSIIDCSKAYAKMPSAVAAFDEHLDDGDLAVSPSGTQLT
jgi:hypothetical protein